MSAEEDTELRDLIVDSLEKKGVLAKIKAELRASVFLALEETENEKYKIPLSNEAIQRFQETKDGRTTLSLVRDFLEFFHLDYTLAVLDTEISPFKAVIKKGDLEKDLNLHSNMDVPLLTLLLQERSSSKFQQVGNDASRARNVEWKNELNSFQSFSKPENKTFSINDMTNRSSGADDPFFDDPLSGEKESFIFSITGASRNDPKVPVNNVPQPEKTNSVGLEISQSGYVTARGYSDDPDLEDDILSGLLQKKMERTNIKKPELALENSVTSLSSLKDLPSLQNVKPKGGDDYEDDFQSSESGKSASKHDEKKSNAHSKENTEGSFEDDIEEDISIAADDLLNTSISMDDENDATSDRTISHLSGAVGFDYMEKLS